MRQAIQRNVDGTLVRFDGPQWGPWVASTDTHDVYYCGQQDEGNFLYVSKEDRSGYFSHTTPEK